VILPIPGSKSKSIEVEVDRMARVVGWWGGLPTRFRNRHRYQRRGTSVATPTAAATANITIPAPAAVFPLWHQSDVNAIAYQTQQRVETDSAAFAGFSASVTAEDAGQKAKADQTTTTDYDRRGGAGAVRGRRGDPHPPCRDLPPRG
jgi:hypothetical protein